MVTTLITKDNIDWINKERLKVNRFTMFNDILNERYYIREDFCITPHLDNTRLVSFEEFLRILNKQTIIEVW